MELNKILKNNMRGQLFTLTTLLFFILMISVLFSFALLSTQYYTQQQNTVLSSGAISLITLINSTAKTFGVAASKQAIAVLSYYEYNATLRKGNFIENTSKYLSYLIENGILPNAPVGSSGSTYVKVGMGSLTFYNYNLSFMNSYAQLGLQSINETNFVISQTSPYSITISYTENIRINQTADVSNYSLPISFNVNISNEPDLFYAQQNILRNIQFGNMQNLTSIITGSFAKYGNFSKMSYGTVVYTGGNGCPSYSASQEASMILVANQLSNINTCANNFAGLIMNITGLQTTQPFLTYSSNILLKNYFKTGQSILLYGPSLESLNIQNLISSISKL